MADTNGGIRKMTLMSTGSEMALALQAHELLQAQGVSTAVVTMPFWQLFEAQGIRALLVLLAPFRGRVSLNPVDAFQASGFWCSRVGFPANSLSLPRPVIRKIAYEIRDTGLIRYPLILGH